MTYQRVILATDTIDGEPGLPAKLRGLSDATLADIEAAIDPCPAGYEGVGYLPIQPADPTPEHKVVTGQTVEWVGGAPKWVETLEDGPLAPLTRRRFLLALLSIGITSADIEAEINTIVDPADREVALIEFREASLFERDHPTLMAIGASFALTDMQIDTLWLWAADL